MPQCCYHTIPKRCSLPVCLDRFLPHDCIKLSTILVGKYQTSIIVVCISVNEKCATEVNSREGVIACREMIECNFCIVNCCFFAFLQLINLFSYDRIINLLNQFTCHALKVENISFIMNVFFGNVHLGVGADLINGSNTFIQLPLPVLNLMSYVCNKCFKL